jgi:hypothetical protein
VVNDWYDNGRVDRVYELHCYQAAIRILPVDVRDYSSAREDIQRALAFATQGKSDPGDGPAATTPTTSTPPAAQPPPPPPSPAPPPPPPPPATTDTDTTPTTPSGGGGNGGNGGTKEPGGTTTAPTVPVTTGGATVAEAIEPANTSGPSAVPMPLIILGGLALLLLAAGSAGYVTRRLQSRRSDGEPPAAA